MIIVVKCSLVMLVFFVLFVFILCLVCSMLPVSMDCAFSNVYLFVQYLPKFHLKRLDFCFQERRLGGEPMCSRRVSSNGFVIIRVSIYNALI
jgi:hypothetical protein